MVDFIERDETAHTKSMAQDLARIAAQANQTATTEEPVDEGPIDVPAMKIATVRDRRDPIPEEAPVTPEPTPVEPEEEYVEEEIPIDMYQSQLAELGIDIGVDPYELPDEALPAYEALVDHVLQVSTAAMQSEAASRERLYELEEFSERLQNSPEKILLAMAIEKPEVWGQVQEIVERMQDDPGTRESVIRELQAEVQLMEAQRINKVQDTQRRLAQGRKVSQEVARQARRYGVDLDVAREYVSTVVKANDNWMEVQQVEPLIQKLSGRKQKLTVKKVRPKRVTPAENVARQTANTQPVATTTAPTQAPSPGHSYDERPRGRGGPFKSLIRSASRRARAVEQ